MFSHPLDRIHAGERGFRAVPPIPKEVGHRVADVFIVIDDQQRTMMRFAHRHTLPATSAPSAALRGGEVNLSIVRRTTVEQTKSAGRPLELIAVGPAGLRAVPVLNSARLCRER
jgi:hypothetical protein